MHFKKSTEPFRSHLFSAPLGANRPRHHPISWQFEAVVHLGFCGVHRVLRCANKMFSSPVVSEAQTHHMATTR